ncbi:MAG TPA: M13 family metallopeptidase [Chthoniobacterales bacterium]|jgi:putative endopeptidase
MKVQALVTGILIGLTGQLLCAEPERAAHEIGVDLSMRDTSVKPGDDFEKYANGGWRNRTEIPLDRTQIGTDFEAMERAEKRTATLIHEAGKGNPALGSPQRMIADYCAAYMDTAEIAKRGIDPLKDKLAEIDKISSKSDLARVLGERLRADVDPINAVRMWTEHLLGLFVTQALSDPGRTVPYLLQGGLGMPDREYYISDKPEMTKLRAAYRTYVGELLKAAKMSEPGTRAERIVTLETKMAQAHLDRTASQDMHTPGQPQTVADLETSAPGLEWNTYLSAAGLEKQPMFIIWQPAAIKGLSALVASEPLDSWKDWFAFHTINENASYLPPAYDDLQFGFYGKEMAGAPKQRERWKRAIANVNTDLRDAVGKIYVARYFPPSSKTAVQEMVKNLLAAFDRRIDALQWMSPATKGRAKAKLKTLRVGVGYPETWRRYDGLTIRRDDPLGNAWRAREWEYHHQAAKLNQPIDRGEWWLTPQTWDAVNLPLQNALNFPAAILEAPYFNPKADVAANYGAMGAMIGHEISHSFDTTGAEFNSEGKLKNWWTPKDLTHFKEAGKRLIDQFNAYEPLSGFHINGAQTLGENIADVAGLATAYDAYRMALQGIELPVVGGLTGDQRFFLAFAQRWRTKIRDAELRQVIVSNEHAPGRERAQTVRNIDAWYDAYGVKPGEKLYLTPDDRVRIW